MNKFHAEMFGNLNFFVLEWVNHVVIKFWQVIDFAHLALNHSNRKIGGINWRKRTKFWQKMFTGTDVIKVSVGKENRFHFAEIILEVFNIRNHVVHTWIIFRSEEYTHVDHDHFVFVFDHGHVLADTEFTDTADWNHAHRFWIWTSRLELGVRHLGTVVAIETRFIHGYADDVLGGLGIHVL